MNLPLRALSVLALAAASLLSACFVVPARHYGQPAVFYQNQPAPGYDNDVVVGGATTPPVLFWGVAPRPRAERSCWWV